MQEKACALLACEKLVLYLLVKSLCFKRKETERGGAGAYKQERFQSKESQNNPFKRNRTEQNRTIIPALEEKPLKKVTPNLQQEETEILLLRLKRTQSSVRTVSSTGISKSRASPTISTPEMSSNPLPR
jgi:hypothetical protein